MDIIACLKDKNLSYNSVKMIQKSCFLIVAKPGLGYQTGTILKQQKQLLTEHSEYSQLC